MFLLLTWYFSPTVPTSCRCTPSMTMERGRLDARINKNLRDGFFGVSCVVCATSRFQGLNRRRRPCVSVAVFKNTCRSRPGPVKMSVCRNMRFAISADSTAIVSSGQTSICSRVISQISRSPASTDNRHFHVAGASHRDFTIAIDYGQLLWMTR